MKPGFALNFTDDSVALLHRTRRGWLEVGRCDYDTPDLAEAMAYLRATAFGLSPQGVTTKLVIPASQIRYFRISAPGPSDADRRAQIAAALDGRTAYAVEELAFDWSGDGPVVDVAVVAHETLDEAESFATQHRFAPLSFVAQPQDAAFHGEPWFGPTAQASGLSDGGDAVERDAEPITILSRAHPREDMRDTAPQAPSPQTLPPQAPAAAQPVVAAASPAPAPQRVPSPDLSEPAPKPVLVVKPDPAPEPAPRPTPVPEPDPATMSAPIKAAPSAPPQPAKTTAPDPDEAPIALDVEDDEPSSPAPLPSPPAAPVRPPRPDPMSAKVTDTSLMIEDEAPPATPTFTSRRLPALAGATAAAAQSMARRFATRTTPPTSTKPSPKPSPKSSQTAAPSPRIPKLGFSGPNDPPPRDTLPGDMAPRAAPTLKAAPQAAATAPAPKQAGEPVRPRVTGTSTLAVPRPQAARPVTPVLARKGPRSLTPPQRGKPRYFGLILTGVLLLALALAAALSTYYSVGSAPADISAVTTDVANNAASPEAVPAAAADLPSVDEEMAADGQDSETAASAVPPPSGADLTTADLGIAPQTAPVAPANTAPTNIAPEAAPAMQAATKGNDEIYLSVADVAPSAVDAAALPGPEARGDPPPLAPLPPPAFGTVYTFDANGLIVPTPEGITTPEGVLLVAGKPPLVPPPRPADLAPPATQALPTDSLPTQAPPTDAAAATGDQTQAFPADPALRDNRPAARPAGFAAADAATAPTDDPSLAPQPDSRLAAIRPVARPASIAPASIAPASIDTASVGPAATASTLALVTPDGATAPLGGLTLSPRPVARPPAIASAVEAAVAAAALEPAPEPAPDSATADDGTVTPETESEPQLASAAPAIPTQANVAKEATTKNVLNLGKINLIGVYGTQSNRYALVRQPNGRIIRVGVGDRIDGGRVAAVTATEVRYEKRGQMLVLAMPRG